MFSGEFSGSHFKIERGMCVIMRLSEGSKEKGRMAERKTEKNKEWSNLFQFPTSVSPVTHPKHIPVTHLSHKEHATHRAPHTHTCTQMTVAFSTRHSGEQPTITTVICWPLSGFTETWEELHNNGHDNVLDGLDGWLAVHNRSRVVHLYLSCA